MVRFILSMALVFGGMIRLAAQPKYADALLARMAANKKTGTSDSLDLLVRLAPESALKLPHRLLHQYTPAGIRLIRIPASGLLQLKEARQVHFADLAQTPKEEVTTGNLDISLNRLNEVHRRTPNVQGTGIRISIKEQRFDTADIDYRSRYFLTGVEAPGSTTHASLMATIAAGAGNSSPQAIGAAPAAALHSASFFNLLPDNDALFSNEGISVQNHSYGTVVENRYGLEAMAYDLQVLRQPFLLHVFSSGNSGAQTGTGPYQGVPGWANLTGNFKYAKNVLTVGAVDSFGRIMPYSSKGPAFDGRIKPELVAFGEDGSSGAAALVSGTAALLQQAYRDQKGHLPTAALVKAILINSALDVGPEGVDHQSGWGNLDGWMAVQTVLEQRYATVPVDKGSSRSVFLDLPGGIQRLKLTICWIDSPATVETNRALFNDVDARLRHTASGAVWQPWVLTAHRDSLQQPARRGVDTVNNTEQITLDFPQPGRYELQLDGLKLHTASQEVAIAWQADTTGAFSFTYPTPGQSIEADRPVLVRWRTQIQGNGTLQWEKDGGDWQTIADPVDLKRGAIYLTPTGNPGSLRLRMLLPGGTAFLSGSFLVSKATTIQVGLRCGDSTLIYWRGTGADAYQLYRLGQKYLVPVQVVRDTFVVVRQPPSNLEVYSVAPLVSGQPAVRSFSLNVAAGSTGCYVRAFYVQQQLPEAIVLRAELGSSYGLAMARVQKWMPGSGFATLGDLPAGPLQFFISDSFPVQGRNRYRLQLLLHDGRWIDGETIDAYHFTNLPVQAFPNPVGQGGALTLLSQLPGKYSVEMFDMVGRRLGQWRLAETTNSLPMRYPGGIYFLRVRSDEGVTGVLRVVIN